MAKNPIPQLMRMFLRPQYPVMEAKKIEIFHTTQTTRDIDEYRRG
ncbi:hypothetical protein [Candidatus Mycobacterium methanotrophicum]|nr:hypothetical protein [Candidatus Mycobacterium methanotrophicum]